MTKYPQLIKHVRGTEDPAEIGDCFRTSIACLLDVPPAEVEHFTALAELEKADSDKLAIDWLAARGWELVFYRKGAKVDAWFDHVTGERFEQPPLEPDEYYLGSGWSPRIPNVYHTVVCQNGEIVWDPHPDAVQPFALNGPVLEVGRVRRIA